MINRNIVYILHIRDSIIQIEKYVSNLSKVRFLRSEEKQDAIIRRLEVIGEAVKNISSTFRKKYCEVKWKKIAGFRDVLIHEYFGVNIDLVWEIIRVDVPKLKKQIDKIILDNKQEVILIDK